MFLPNIVTKAKKQISIPSELFLLLTKKASRFGVSPSQYILSLILIDAKTEEYAEEYIENITDPEIMKDIGASLEEYKQGKTRALKSKTDISQYIQELVEKV